MCRRCLFAVNRTEQDHRWLLSECELHKPCHSKSQADELHHVPLEDLRNEMKSWHGLFLSINMPLFDILLCNAMILLIFKCDLNTFEASVYQIYSILNNCPHTLFWIPNINTRSSTRYEIHREEVIYSKWEVWTDVVSQPFHNRNLADCKCIRRNP